MTTTTTLPLKFEQDAAGILTPHHVIEVNGLPVAASNALPVSDLATEVALGTPADAPWSAGAGSAIALFKAMCGNLLSLVANTTGGVTAAGQATGNSSLATIATNLTPLATSAGQASVLTQATVSATALGTPADAAWSSGAGSAIALFKAMCGYLASLVANTTGGATAAGQATANSSLATIATVRAYTYAAGTASVVTTGGTAVTAITGPVKGGYIVNPETAANQGIVAAEPLLVDPVGTASTSPGNGNGTASPLDPGQTWCDGQSQRNHFGSQMHRRRVELVIFS